ncbi:hypothetical protein KP509_38G057500 [Ceratopteris richardii]|nr:hypothetical protein KP509_38G057500 [Ceratopteris richardii]
MASVPFIHVMLPTRLAWALMESPPVLLTPLLFSFGRYSSLAAPRVLMSLFFAHYAHRSLFYPLRMRPSSKRNLPLPVFVSAVIFNVYNTYIQVRSVSHYTQYPSSWLLSFQFILGAVLFISGMAINITADYALISLRKSDTPRVSESSRTYKIPHGGLFELISCPNYFGEVLEWLGWAVAAGSLSSVVFFLLTVSNLVPRAVSHHQWYVQNFREYPRSRKMLIPYLF